MQWFSAAFRYEFRQHGRRFCSSSWHFMQWSTCTLLSNFQAGSFLSSYLAGIAMYHTGRWDIVFYGSSVVTAIWCILFVKALSFNHFSVFLPNVYLAFRRYFCVTSIPKSTLSSVMAKNNFCVIKLLNIWRLRERIFQQRRGKQCSQMSQC